MKLSRIPAFLLSLLLILLPLAALADVPDYTDPSLWACFGSEEGMAADVFFIAPTNVMGSAEHLNADLSSKEEIAQIQYSIGMQTGIYNTSARFFAPYYRQMTMAGYELPEQEREPYLATAEGDVLAAFSYYMEHENGGRPVIIAGFSQGADLGLRLLKAYAGDEAFAAQLVAAYLIGWRVTDEDLSGCPALRMAQGETDTGVIISFDCEAEDVTGTIIVPEGVFTHSINPLNWRTDSVPAPKEANLGYVYPAGDGSVKAEIPQLCGAWLDPVRGTLKVTDVTPEEYPARLSIFPEGSYHIYDYEFFYRNLQANVQARLKTYLEKSR